MVTASSMSLTERINTCRFVKIRYLGPLESNQKWKKIVTRDWTPRKLRDELKKIESLARISLLFKP